MNINPNRPLAARTRAAEQPAGGMQHPAAIPGKGALARRLRPKHPNRWAPPTVQYASRASFQLKSTQNSLYHYDH